MGARERGLCHASDEAMIQTEGASHDVKEKAERRHAVLKVEACLSYAGESLA
jgi:hypothetical protein